MIKTPVKKGFEMNYWVKFPGKTIETDATPKTLDQTVGRLAKDVHST
jgi:hypothetical protein